MLQQLKFLAGIPRFRQAPLSTAARLGSWKIRCLLERGAVVDLEGTSLKMALPPQWHGHPKLLYALGWRFDPELPFLAGRIAAGDVVFDIGANIGTWSLILSEAVGATGRVLACEPTLATYNTLASNIRLNARTNVVATRCALSNGADRLRLYHDVDASRNSLGQTRGSESASYEDVPARTLDSLVTELALDRLDFIKIDVEGAEPLVFDGARQTLTRFRPAILFEVNPKALTALGFEFDSAWRLLSDLCYRFYELRDDGLEAVRECPPEGGTSGRSTRTSRPRC